MLPSRMINLIQKFDSKWDLDQKSGCWIWKAEKNWSGYGIFTIRKPRVVFVRAHRFSLEIYLGVTIPRNLLVCHLSDDRRCVNPGHLFVGTHKDNMQDAKNKNRWPKGEEIPSSKLTEREVREIRLKYIPRLYGCPRLAKEYGVSLATIKAVIKQETWKHVR